MTTQNRFKSAILWSAIVAQVVSILLLIGVISTGLGDTINATAAAVLQLFVILGIFNNPVTQDKF